MKSVLVVLYGIPRGGVKTWESQVKNLYHDDVDFAICTNKDGQEKYQINKQIKFNWIFNEYDDWYEYYEKNFNHDWKKVFELGHGTGLYESGKIHFAIKDILLKNYLPELLKYEYIVFSRFDQFIVSQIEYFPEKILIPKGEDYFGICDRFAVVPRKYIVSYLNICDFIDDYLLNQSLPNYLNCETVFKMHLKFSSLLSKVHRFERNMFTTSQKGDKTNWRVAKYKVYLYKDLYLKYPQEFIASIQYLILNNESYAFRYFRLLINYTYLKIRIVIGRTIKNNQEQF